MHGDGDGDSPTHGPKVTATVLGCHVNSPALEPCQEPVRHFMCFALGLVFTSLCVRDLRLATLDRRHQGRVMGIGRDCCVTGYVNLNLMHEQRRSRWFSAQSTRCTRLDQMDCSPCRAPQGKCGQAALWHSMMTCSSRPRSRRTQSILFGVGVGLWAGIRSGRSTESML